MRRTLTVAGLLALGIALAAPEVFTQRGPLSIDPGTFTHPDLAIEKIVLVDWTPRRMNLVLATPEEDPGHRRISQRAVDDLTEIGGGLQAALSAPFLRLFDDFPYRRLGIGCALEGDRCRMSGVADRADGSFVLVEGRGIPRLQVIGYTREVDWPVLIERLQAVRAEQDTAVE